MTKPPHLNYLGVPIQTLAHYGQLADMRHMETYLARTDQATFNVLAVLYPTMFTHLEAPSEEPLKTQLAERAGYDAAFRRIYREMAAALQEGLTLRDAALQLPPRQLLDRLGQWQPASAFTCIFLEAVLKSSLPEKAVALAEHHMINL